MSKILRTVTQIIVWFLNILPADLILRYYYLIYSKLFSTKLRLAGKGVQVKPPVLLMGGKYISIGDSFTSLDNLRMECWDEFEKRKYSPKLEIGHHVAFNRSCHIGCINHIKIGNHVLVGSNVLITDHQHGHLDKRDLKNPPAHRDLTSRGPVIIENNVWIGENACIMPGIVIGENCIIGANAVVTKSFPKNCVIAGNPARVIKELG